MEIKLELVRQPIPSSSTAGAGGDTGVGAVLVFDGIVRGEESGSAIAALEYEAYESMALSEMRRILNELAGRHPCREVRVTHRTGVIPVGETAIRVEVHSAHRQEGLAMLASFMDRLKEDVPIWKARAVSEP
jgi:molybdopterin synthase catalytic subunit